MKLTVEAVLAFAVCVNLTILGWNASMTWAINERLIRVEEQIKHEKPGWAKGVYND